MIRRARPLLGTLVAISADGPAAGVDAAFAAIEEVQRLMSAQRAGSDIGRINRHALRSSVEVHPWTFAVLERAAAISRQTGGAFDVVAGARHTDLVLEPNRVRLRRPARVDVSGIAKGFAVDLAVDLLRAGGATSGSVNAGGDLRFFGAWSGPVRVRSPAAPQRAVCLPASPHQAFATSCGYFGSSIHDSRTGACSTLDWSVTVAAATCLVADALTKAVALVGPQRSLLDAFGALAYAVDRDGALHAAAG